MQEFGLAGNPIVVEIIWSSNRSLERVGPWRVRSGIWKSRAWRAGVNGP